MTFDEAVNVFDQALCRAFQESDDLRETIEKMLAAGIKIVSCDVNVRLKVPDETTPLKLEEDMEFLRSMAIVPDVTPEMPSTPGGCLQVCEEAMWTRVLASLKVAFWFVVWIVLSLLAGGKML